jgi:WD40 repeat protein/transcriptional regulator with XRE-family HTH domain
VKKSSHRDPDYAFGQLMLTLRMAIGLTQAGLADKLGISRNAIGGWEIGQTYPKAEHLKVFIVLGIQQHIFAAGREAEEIRALWRAAHQKVLLDEDWLHSILVSSPVSVKRFAQAEAPSAHTEEGPTAFPRVDWVGALDVNHFTGREVEVAELTQWIIQERCRMIALLGIGGIGKSMLVSFLGQRLAPQFEAVLWRSVRDAPLCEDLVADCITFFSEEPPAEFPTSLEQRINQLLTCLQSHRCLLVLDNLETLLESGDREGGYLPGYKGYGRLIQRLAESAHQSCVLLTSREKPREIELFEGIRAPVRSLHLAGMSERAAQELLANKGLSGTPAAWQRFVASYAGNPLALKIVAQAVQDLFSGDIDRFLHEGELIFNGIRPVLRQQVGRLTPLEHLLLTWLAVLREWTPLETLMQILHPKVLRTQVLEALEALGRRSLLERGQQATFSLQSVVMEYLTDALVERLDEEIIQGNPQQARRYALEQAQAKDYVRQTQVRLLVHPLIERLRSELGTDAQVEAYLLRLLELFRSGDAITQGYGPANVICLLKDLRGHLRNLNLSRLSIRGAYLQGVEMQDTILSGAMLYEVVFTEAFDAVLSVAVSPDGRYVAAGSNSGQVRVWREEGKVVHLTIRGHTDRVGAIAFSLDGQTLATASWDGTIRLWDLASGATIWTVQDDKVPFTSIAMSPNGKLMSGSYDGALCIWDLRTGTQLSCLQRHGEQILTVAWSADGRLLASGGLDSIIRLWDAEQGTLLRELHGHRDQISRLAFASTTSLLASGSADHMVKLWEVETGTCRITLAGHTGTVTGLAWTRDGRTLASASYDTTLRLWDCQTWQCRHILQGHRDAVTQLAFLPEGDRLLSGSFDHSMRTWDVLSGQNVHAMQGYALALFALTWSPDGGFLLSGSSEATLMLWNVSTGASVQVLRGHKQQVNAVAWSRAGNRIASGSHDQTVRIWDAQTGVCTHILQGHTATVSSVDWSVDDRWLASGGYDCIVRIWDMQEGISQVGSEHTEVINAVVWSPDGTQIASASEDGLVQIWRATDGKLLRRFVHAGFVTTLSWSADGEQLVSGATVGEKGVLSIWDMRQGDLVRTLEGHSGLIWGIDWSPERGLLVSAGTDGTIRWWSPKQGLNLATIQAHDAWVRAVRVSPDGKTVASCGEDGMIKLWDMHSHQHLATLRADRPYERLDISQTSGLTNAQQAALRALGALSNNNDVPTG